MRTRVPPIPPLAADKATAELDLPAQEVFTRIRDAMRTLVNALPGPVNRTVDLQNTLGVYQTLAWRTFKIATVDHPLDVMDYMLTPALVGTLTEAAEKKGVPPAVLDEVRAAMEMYTAFRQAHAGDHESFMMMLASLRPKPKSPLDEKFRKSLFQHNRLLWGHQADVSVACFIVMPEDKGSNARTAAVTGAVGYHRLRPAVMPPTISNMVAHLDVDHSHERTTSDGLITEFCSPDLRVEPIGNDTNAARVRLVVPNIGRQSAVHYFQLFTSTARFDKSEYAELNLDINLVAAMLHQDILLPASDSPRKMLAQVYGQNGELSGVGKIFNENLMPVELSPEYLGSSADVPPADGVPRYTEMIRSVLKRFGQYGRAFDVYRCRMPYPIMRTRVSLIVEPPEGA